MPVRVDSIRSTNLIVPGVCSLTLRNSSPREVVDLVARGGLETIEWWGIGHVPPGDFASAREAGKMTRDAGLAVSTYGSYHHVGTDKGPGFGDVLKTAVALGAPSIRVWAGDKGRAASDAATVGRVIREALRCADLAAGEGISITFEFHGGTLTDTGANACWFAGELAHPNIHFSWQPPHGFTVEKNLAGLGCLVSRLLTLHVFHWTIGSYEKNLFDEEERPPRWPGEFFRHPLADGVDAWRRYLECAAGGGRGITALLEFVRNDSPEAFLEDAAVLIELCRRSPG